MLLNSDFTEPVVLDTRALAWQASPASGVERKPLDRIGDEVARATSIVRYAAGSRFSEHEHGLGEEFLVLSGVFVDEHGSYPAGTYVRNPPGSRHSPGSPDGCELFVKLRQFDPADRQRVVIDTRTAAWRPGPVGGASVLPLHCFGSERVTLVRLSAGVSLAPRSCVGGAEILVLEGSLADESGEYPQGSWIRWPHMSRHAAFTDTGCLIYEKTGHLPAAP